MYLMGGTFGFAIGKRGHIHRLLLPVILHIGFVHMLFNNLFLLMMSFTVEHHLGRWYKFLGFYLVTAFGGNIFASVMQPYSVCVGASSAGYGIIAATSIILYKNWNVLGLQKFRYAVIFGFFVVISFLYAFVAPG